MPQIQIAKINGHEHRQFTDTYKVRGFPTLFLHVRDAKEPTIMYKSARTAEDIANFIAEHTGTLLGTRTHRASDADGGVCM